MTAVASRAAETWAHLLRCQREGVPAFPWALDYAQDGYGDLAEACAAVEAVAQQHLDAHPDDHAARRLLGEWLTACGDKRGEGLAALGMCGLRPLGGEGAWSWYRTEGHNDDPDELPRDWFTQIDLSGCSETSSRTLAHWGDWLTRQAAEDAAALAFLRLPESRRAELLRGGM